jgi:hypothetical protein
MLQDRCHCIIDTSRSMIHPVRMLSDTRELRCIVSHSDAGTITLLPQFAPIFSQPTSTILKNPSSNTSPVNHQGLTPTERKRTLSVRHRGNKNQAAFGTGVSLGNDVPSAIPELRCPDKNQSDSEENNRDAAVSNDVSRQVGPNPKRLVKTRN